MSMWCGVSTMTHCDVSATRYWACQILSTEGSIANVPDGSNFVPASIEAAGEHWRGKQTGHV